MPQFSRRVATTIVLLAALACSLDDPARATRPPDTTPVTHRVPGVRVHVLFIGNSLTYENDLPGTVAALAAFAGDTVNVESVTGGGLALIDHYNGATNALQVVDRGGWDYVVLQQGPTSTTGLDRDTLVLAARLFDEHVKAH
jgi:hypothetical protein